MKKILLTATLAIFSFGAFAQDDAAMKAFMDYATPGEMHKMLGKYSGQWTATTKMWMAPGTEPMTSTAEVFTDMYMGNRYQKSLYKGDMMGMPFEGEATTGYDNIKKTFTSTWTDNFSTGLMYGEGKWDAKTKTIEIKGAASDPMTQGQSPFRQVTTLTDDNTYKMEMYNMMGGQEFKSMEITFTRKK